MKSINGKRNTPAMPEVILISLDRLSLIVTKFDSRASSRGDWKTPLSVTVTLGIIFPVSDFKHFLGIDGSQWQVVVVLAAVASTIWFAIELSKLRRRQSSGDLIQEICENSDRQDDHRGIFFFYGRDQFGTDRIVVYFDEVWDCYLLPNTDVRGWDLGDSNSDSPLAAYAGRLIGVDPSQVTVRWLESAVLRSTKLSVFDRREKSYTFEFLHVLVSNPRVELQSKIFVSGGRKFIWMSIPELLQDEKTRSRNSDVLHHIEGHFSQFYHHMRTSVPIINIDNSAGDR